MGVRWSRSLRSVLAEKQTAPLSYPERGATAGPLPAGYGHLRRRTHIGSGPGALERAADALHHWRMHRGAGLIVAADGPAEVGRTVVLGLGRPLSLVLPCRVVWTLDEEHRRGFAYGTLPDHPECGEESFVVERDSDGLIWLNVTAFSRPVGRVVRLGGPANLAAQKFFVRRYARALARAAAPEDGSFPQTAAE